MCKQLFVAPLHKSRQVSCTRLGRGLHTCDVPSMRVALQGVQDDNRLLKNIRPDRDGIHTKPRTRLTWERHTAIRKQTKNTSTFCAHLHFTQAALSLDILAVGDCANKFCVFNDVERGGVGRLSWAALRYQFYCHFRSGMHLAEVATFRETMCKFLTTDVQMLVTSPFE